jgi:hypothetical protein
MLDNKGEQKETIRQVLLNSRINLQLSDYILRLLLLQII